MRRYRRWIAAFLAAAAAALFVFPGFALPAADPFAEFHIGANSSDTLQRTLSIARYGRGADGLFQSDGAEEYACKLNRVTGDADFYIQTAEDGVWVTVDYLTDVDGDGVYELLDGGSEPVWEIMDSQCGLVPSRNGIYTLTAAQMYILSSDLLVQHSRQAVQNRLAGGVHALEGAPKSAAQTGYPLCVITLHRANPAGGQDLEEIFYLQIYEEVLIPLDISPEDPCYDAVVFCLFHGYFTGTGGGRFSPDAPLTRAQLAQVLWTMCGSQEAPPTSFSDVPEDAWYYQAISWCQQTGLITGYDASTFDPEKLLNREEMASILYRYARYTGSSLRATANMSQFTDQASVSPWAYTSVRWAATNWLIHTDGGALLPQKTVTRAELAEALYCYDINLAFQGF